MTRSSLIDKEGGKRRLKSMFRNKTPNSIRVAQIILFILGILIIALGFYATGPRLVQFATEYLSSDKSISEPTITASLYGLRVKIILSGAVLVLLAGLVGFSVALTDSFMRGVELKSVSLIEKSVSFIERLLSSVYRIATNEKFLWCLLILIIVSFPLPNVFLSPSGGLHLENIDLQPAKNLARHGIYATLTTRGFDEYTHKITAGPGTLLPIALVFKLFGVSVYYSRALYLAFSIAALAMFYIMARDLYGKKVALLALFMFAPMALSLSPAETEYVSGLFYFLAGALFWFKSVDTKKGIYLVLSGLFWGLSFQTKWLFLFAIFAVILTCVILRLANNGLRSRYYVVPSLMVLLVSTAWFVFRIFNVGPGRELWHLQRFWKEHGRRATGVDAKDGILTSILEIDPPIASLTQFDLWGELQLFLIIPAILYVIILIRKSKTADYKSLFFISFTLIWFTWWLLLNYDLPRLHLKPALLMFQLFIAKLLYDAWEYSSGYRTGFFNSVNNKETRKATMSYLLRVAIIFIVLGKVLLPLSEKIDSLYGSRLILAKSYKEMMAHVKNSTEKNAVFSGWDWDMPWYVDLDSSGDRIIKNRASYPPEQRESVPEYFIVSPEWPLVKTTNEWPCVAPDSKYTIEQNEIRKEFLREHATLVKAFGDKHKWLLYRINSDNLAPSTHK